MTFQEWCFGISAVAGALIALTAVGYSTGVAQKVDKATDGGWAVLGGGLIAITLALSAVCWLLYADAYSDEVKDRNYCSSLEERGHTTLFARYNQFNRDCFILVNDQWIRLEDSAWGMNS